MMALFFFNVARVDFLGQIFELRLEGLGTVLVEGELHRAGAVLRVAGVIVDAFDGDLVRLHVNVDEVVAPVAVDERGRESVRLRGSNILCVSCVDLRLCRVEGIRNRGERGVLLCGRERAQRGCGRAGLHAHFMNLLFYCHVNLPPDGVIIP